MTEIGFLQVLPAVGVLLLLAIPGYLARKCRLLPDSAVGTLSAILMYVCAPFLTITSFQGTVPSGQITVNMGWTVLFSALIQILMFGLMQAYFARHPMPREKRGVITYSVMFCNCGYMGIPLLVLLGMTEAVIYAAVYIAVFNILCWTVGVYALTGEKKYVSLKKAICNPPTLALFVALPLYFFRVDLATSAVSSLYPAVEMLGNMTTPVAMLMLGIRLADMKPAQIFCGARNYLYTALRLVLAPLILFEILYFLPLSPVLKVALFLIAGMPSASASVAFAEKFGGDTYLAARLLLLTSVFSVLTVPLLAFLFPYLVSVCPLM